MNTFQWITDEAIYALGWTLAHSLWQIALAGLVLTIALPYLPMPQHRYRAAFSTLPAVLGMAVATFLWYYVSYQPEVITIQLPAASAAASVHWVDQPPVPGSGWEQAKDWFEDHHSTFVGIWLTGFVVLLLRMGGGIWYLGYLKEQAVAIPESRVPFAHLVHHMGIRRPVRLLRSTLVKAPLVFGYFKPVILFPAGLLNGLTPVEVEAILLHELAHIVRRDWLMNLLQTFTEAIFYFHPVVWWISSVVRQERERCCDEMAVSAVGNNRLVYARALMQVQVYTQTVATTTSPDLALAADGGRSRWFRRRAYLLERIQFILLQSPQQKSMIMERMLITGLLLATLTFWGLQAAPPLPVLSSTASEWLEDLNFLQPQPMENDTTPPKMKKQFLQRISEDDGKQKIDLELQNGEISRLSVDGKVIAPAEYGKYEALTDKLIAEHAVPPPPPPAPPAPPSPPAPPTGAWPFAAPPPPPPVPGTTWEMAPPPPPPPPPGGRVFIDKDGEKNTVIVLEQGNGKTEIVVRDGKVIIDGKEMEAGKSLPLNSGIMDWNNYPGGNVFINDDRKVMFFPEGAELPKGVNLSQLEDLERLQIELEQRHADRETMLRDFEVQIADHETMLRDAEVQAADHEVMLRDSEVRLAEEAHQMAWAALAPHENQSIAFFSNQSFNEVLVGELHRDYLITDPNNYSVEITAKKLKVNGKKQPENMLKKYLNLYNAHHGKPFGAKDVIKFEVRN